MDVPLVVARDHFLFECLIEIFGIPCVLHGQVVVHAAVADGKAVIAVIRSVPFTPEAILIRLSRPLPTA